MYAYDAELEPKANNDWEFKPVISDEKAPIAIDTLVPGDQVESVYTPAVIMALAMVTDED